MPIRPFLGDATFKPEVVAIMSEAFTRACKSLGETKQADVTREIIAGRIIRFARAGERDVKTLCQKSILGLGIKCDCA